MLPAALAQEYLRQKEQLLQAFPELAEDEAALRDTLEGITHAPDLIATFIRDARADEAMAEALRIMIGEMAQRKVRIMFRADRRRLAAQRLMDACGLRKIELPDFTASIRAVPPRVEVDDDASLPDSLCKIVREPNKVAIKEALANGTVAGARMTNGSETLALRFK
jgi:hypothetical protein